MINWTVFRIKVFASRKRVKWQAIVCKKIFSITNSAFVGLTDAYNSAEVTTLGTALAKFVHNNGDGSSCQTMN